MSESEWSLRFLSPWFFKSNFEAWNFGYVIHDISRYQPKDGSFGATGANLPSARERAGHLGHYFPPASWGFTKGLYGIRQSGKGFLNPERMEKEGNFFFVVRQENPPIDVVAEILWLQFSNSQAQVLTEALFRKVKNNFFKLSRKNVVKKSVT